MLAFLRRNWELKLLALAIAAALWTFVTSGEGSRLKLAAPLQYVGVPADLVLVAGPHSVDVELEAPRRALTRLVAGAVRVRVDASRLGEGESIVPLGPDDVEAPPGVVVTRIAPAWVRVLAESTLTAEVAVVPRVEGVPAPGHQLGRIQVEPPTVQARGPRSTIEGRVGVETAPIDVSGRQQGLTRMVDVVTPRWLSLVGRRSVQVSVEITPEDLGGRDARGGDR